LKFSKDGITFEDNQDKLSVLSQSHIALYDLRLANLSEIELKAVQIISAIDSYLDHNMLSVLLSLPVDTLDEVLERLQINNVIQRNVFGQSVQFTSEAIKKHIYYLIRSKKELHLNLAKAISEKLPDFSRLEKARQFELAEVYEESFNILKQELE
jgi:hypothetical protein